MSRSGKNIVVVFVVVVMFTILYVLFNVMLCCMNVFYVDYRSLRLMFPRCDLILYYTVVYNSEKQPIATYICGTYVATANQHDTLVELIHFINMSNNCKRQLHYMYFFFNDI